MKVKAIFLAMQRGKTPYLISDGTTAVLVCCNKLI